MRNLNERLVALLCAQLAFGAFAAGNVMRTSRRSASRVALKPARGSSATHANDAQIPITPTAFTAMFVFIIRPLSRSVAG